MPLTEQSPGVKWMNGWRSLGALLQSARMERSANGGAALRMSSDDFARLVYDELLGSCTLAKQTLSRILAEECDLWTHLTAIEELYLMRRGDVMSNFLDVLFTRVRGVLCDRRKIVANETTRWTVLSRGMTFISSIRPSETLSRTRHG